MSTPQCVRRIDLGHVLLSDGWVVRDSTWHDPSLPSAVAACETTTSETTASAPSSPHGPTLTSSSESDDSPPSVRRRPNRTPLYGSRFGNRLAQKRWNSFVGSPSSRIASTMRHRLGERLWADFVSHANRHYWPNYRRVFTPSSNVLSCSGTVDGNPCPHAFRLDLLSRDVHATSGFLHLDHERKVRDTCYKWLTNLPPRPTSWHDGSEMDELCHALFGVLDSAEGTRCVRFRCSARKVRGRSVKYPHHTYCHTE
jgi:hypothetical protein